jgi:hypothetical protein
MKRHLAVTSARVNKFGVGLNEFTNAIEQAQSCGCMNVHECSTLDRMGG